MSEHRIIVIEDQEDLAALYEASLTGAGYRVTNAYTGEEGVAEFQANGADAIVLDMTLPEMSGAEALRKIRLNSPAVPVIVVTGESSDETRAKCERLGVEDYLSKPVDYNALLASVAQALENLSEEEYEVVTMRLPARLLTCLSEVDPHLERAVARLCEEQLGTPNERSKAE